MAASKEITLSAPVVLHDGDAPITAVTIREPTGGNYLDHGEPRILARNPDGTFFWVEDKDAIKAYLGLCLKHEAGPHLLRLMSLSDVRRLREALFGFFADTAPTTSEP